MIGDNQISVKIHQESVLGRGEQRSTFRSDTQNIWARLLNEIVNTSSVSNRYIQTSPVVHAGTESNGFCGNCQHRRMVRHKDDSSSRRYSRFNQSDHVWNGQAAEERPHGEVLEAGWGGRELVAQGIIFHVDSDQVVQPGCWKAQNTRYLFGVEKIGCFVPVNPHSSQVITE